MTDARHEGREHARLNVHVYPSPLRNESRILKITRTLAEQRVFDRILVLGTWDEGLAEREALDETREFWRLRVGGSSRTPWAKATRVLRWSWLVLRSLRDERIDVVNCHSLSVLPLAVLLKLTHRSRLVYDTHELETETVAFTPGMRVIARWVEKLLMRFADATCVVNEHIAQWYREAYGLARVWVVQNVPYRATGTTERSGRMRQRLAIAADAPVFLYQGVVSAGRGIGLLLEAFKTLPGRHLVVLGYGSMVPDVQAAASQYANIHFHAAVPPQDLAAYTADADVGLSLGENVCLSYYLSLPNKLFEYLNAGVPVVTSDFPVMGGTISRYGAGWVTPVTAEAIHDVIAKIDRPAIDAARAKALAARTTFGWHLEEPTLLALYESLGFNAATGADRSLFVEQAALSPVSA